VSDLLEVSVPLGGPADDALRALFLASGGGAVEETRLCGPDDGRDLDPPEHWLRTYVPAADVDGRLRLELGLWRIAQVHPFPDATVRRLSEANWAEAWKAHYRPVRAGEHFLIVPSWLEAEPERGDRVIRLDPGMAFGTGLHPTTRLCLAALERKLGPGRSVLDVGTGTGILAIGAALLGARPVWAIDIAPHAVGTAAANAAANGVTVQAAQGEVSSVPRTFDVVVANLLAVTVTEQAADLAARVAPGGCLIASGILVEQAEGVAAALAAAGLDAPVVTVEGDWVALVAARAGEG
jgi:ribosomal protein L11 methyltransferase